MGISGGLGSTKHAALDVIEEEGQSLALVPVSNDHQKKQRIALLKQRANVFRDTKTAETKGKATYKFTADGGANTFLTGGGLPGA
jgi:hypothetical protein